MSAASPARGPKIDHGQPLTKRHYGLLQARWIDRELADAACLRKVDNQEGAVVLGRKPSGNYAGILIPYLLPGRDRPHTYRVRIDHPDVVDGRQLRYIAPPGDGNRLYFVPGTDPDWLTDTTVSIVIVEGEFKTLALWRLAHYGLTDAAERPRFLPIGIPGAWNWKGKTGRSEDETGTRVTERGPIPDLRLVACQSREVIILYDADLEEKRDVSVARMCFTRELRGRGANVKWFAWPKNLPAGIKGIDDYLAALGPEPALDLIDAAVDPRKGKENGDQGHSTYQLREDGVYYVGFDGASSLFVCSPLKILGRVRNHDGGDWGIYLEWCDYDGRPKRWAMPAAYLAGDDNEYRKYFLENGLRLAPGKKARSIWPAT